MSCSFAADLMDRKGSISADGTGSKTKWHTIGMSDSALFSPDGLAVNCAIF